MEHLRSAQNMVASNMLEYNISMEYKKLYTHMVKTGLEYWRILPIVHIDYSAGTDFKNVADVHEKFWIQCFNTRSTHGLNMYIPKVTLHTTAEPVTRVHTFPISGKKRRFTSRHYKHRLQFLSKQIEELNFNDSTLDGYSLKNQTRMYKCWKMSTLKNSISPSGRRNCYGHCLTTI